jgi:hypothetical protein
VKDGVTRHITFSFSESQQYTLIFTDLKMRVENTGGIVTNAAKAISNTTNATPVVVTSNAHGYSNGDEVFIAGTGIAALDNKFWIVAGAAANTFQLQGSTAPGTTSVTGTAARVFVLTTTYAAADLQFIRYDQLNDVMILCCPGYPIRQLSRTAHDAWTLVDFDYQQGPFQDGNVDRTKAIFIDGELVNSAITITATNNIFTANNVGQLLYLEQKDFGHPWQVSESVTKGSSIRRADGKYYKALTTGTTGTLRPSVDTPGDTESDGVVTWQFLHAGFGIAKITGFISATVVTGTILLRMPSALTGGAQQSVTGAVAGNNNQIRLTVSGHGFVDDDTITVFGVTGTTEANGIWAIDVIDANHFELRDTKFVNAYVSGGKVLKGGTYKYALGAWGGDQGYPQAVAHHQQRRFFAASTADPTRIWGSGTNSYNFYGKSVPTQADDAVAFRTAGGQANAIRHLTRLTKLMPFTQGSEWVISGGDNDAIAPNAIFGKDQSYNGISTLRPLFVRDVLLYIQEKGGIVRDFGFNFATDSFIGTDLTVMSSHLVKNHTIVSWAFQKYPFSCIWMVRDDGVLLGLTYLREQQVLAWHRHDTQGGLYEQVSTITEFGEDTVYFTVNRNGRRFFERMASRNYTSILDAHFVDCGVVYDGRNTTAKTMTLSGGVTWGYATETFTLTASSGEFAASNVTNGDEIHLTDNTGRKIRLKIIAFTSATVVTVSANRDIPVELRNVAVTAWGHAKKFLIGADHLATQAVSVLADGHVVSNGIDDNNVVVAADGSVTLATAGVVIRIGVPMTADFGTLRVAVSSSPAATVNKKNISKVAVTLEDSRSLYAGPTFDDQFAAKERDDNDNYDDPIPLTTGQEVINVTTKWTDDGLVCFRHKDPLPITILAVAPDVEVGGVG